MNCTYTVGLWYAVLMEEETFGQRVRRARDAKMLSQAELAELAEMNREHIADIERGRAGKRPWPKTVRALARALDVDPHWLRDGTTAEDNDA